MRVMVCADAHANLPALEAVLSAVSGVDRKVFLGDSISYGPHPKECLDLVMESFDLVLAGNHDLDATEERRPPGPGQPRDDYDWGEWTKGRLTPGDLDIIRRLPRDANEEWDGRRVHLAHRPPGPYMMPDIPEDELVQRVQGMPGEIVFLAHAHRPMDRMARGRRIINPGSIGQQRDGDPRAAYAVFEDGEITFFRVEYDVARTIRDLRALPLRREFAECWCDFFRRGVVDTGAIPPPAGQGGADGQAMFLRHRPAVRPADGAKTPARKNGEPHF